MKQTKIGKGDKIKLVFIFTESQVKQLLNNLIVENKKGRI